MYKCFLFLLGTFVLVGCDNSLLEPLINEPIQHEFKWVKLMGGSQEDIAHSVISTQDGGFAILGNTQSIDGDITDKSAEVSDLWLLKFSADFSLAWSKTYGGSADDRGHSLVQLSDGGFALLGYAMSDDGDASVNQGQHDNWVLRVDANGVLMWEKSFGFLGHDHAYNILNTSDGGLLFNGFLDVTSSNGEGASTQKNAPSALHGVGEFWVHKINLDGSLAWRRYFGGTNNDRSYDAVETPDGGYVVVGTSESNDVEITNARGGYDVWIIKLDREGNLLWEKSFGGSGIDGANGVALAGEKIHVFGNSFSNDLDISSPLGSSDFWLLTLSEEGDLLNETSLGGSDFDMGRDLWIDKDQKIWLTGYSQSSNIDLTDNRGDNDIILMQLGQNYLPQQTFSLGGSRLDIAHSITGLPSGGILVVGTTESTHGVFSQNRGNKDIVIAFWDEVLE